MTSDMKLVYKAFAREFQRLNMRMDELNDKVNEVFMTATNNTRRDGSWTRDIESSGSENNEVSNHLLRRRPKREEPKAKRHELREKKDDKISSIKMQVPPFKGRHDAEVYLLWESKVGLIFACHNYSEEKKVRLAAVEFTDYALV